MFKELFTDDINEAYSTIAESLSEKKFAKALENGEHIFIPDTEVVLWYSLSDKRFMIDMKPSTFEDVYNLYKKEDKRHHGELKTENTNPTKH